MFRIQGTGYRVQGTCVTVAIPAEETGEQLAHCLLGLLVHALDDHVDGLEDDLVVEVRHLQVQEAPARLGHVTGAQVLLQQQHHLLHQVLDGADTTSHPPHIVQPDLEMQGLDLEGWRGQRAEARGQRTEGREQRAESRGQRADKPRRGGLQEPVPHQPMFHAQERVRPAERLGGLRLFHVAFVGVQELGGDAVVRDTPA